MCRGGFQNIQVTNTKTLLPASTREPRKSLPYAGTESTLNVVTSIYHKSNLGKIRDAFLRVVPIEGVKVTHNADYIIYKLYVKDTLGGRSELCSGIFLFERMKLHLRGPSFK